MADVTDSSDDKNAMLAEEEKRRRAGRLSLDEEIVRKYDPERLRKMVAKGAGRGENLDLATRGDMERMLPGNDFSSVRVFRGPLAEEVTRHHKADAVTIGNTGMILVRESPRSSPGTTAGRALLAHELTHVAQAQRGMQFAKEGGGEGEHEKEAEQVEAHASRGGTHAGGREDSRSREKDHARRRAIMERVYEILDETRLIRMQRNGDDWSR